MVAGAPVAARRVLPRAAVGWLAVAQCLALLSFGAELGAETGTLARVGLGSIDVATFRSRCIALAPSEWRALGASWGERRRRLLDEVLIPEALLAHAAEGEAGARDAALSRALLAELATEAGRAAPTEAELAADHAANQAELETPQRLALWRILLPSEAAARAVIARLSPPLGATFKQLAREQSIDTATHMRGGNLGLVAADGQTHLPELRVAPALFEAAARVRDGELVPEPVREGDGFAVVWRRGSRPASVLARADATRLISARFSDERRARAQNELIIGLRRERLADYHPELAVGYVPAFTESAQRSPRTAPAAEPSPPVRLVPAPTDQGLR
jgi:peptidyl-prolyl cis-trans isomerase C